MTDNTRARQSKTDASAPRDASQGEPKRRRRRGRGKSRSQHAGRGGQKGGQHSSKRQEKTAEGSRDNSEGNKPNNPQRKRRRGGQNNKGHNRNSARNRNNRGGRRRSSVDQRRRAQYQDRYDSSIPTRDETSAGGLVVSGMAEAVDAGGNVDLSKIYAALIGRLDRRGRLLWSMPKGHVEDNEHQWTTAEREVWEETGIYGEAFDTLGTIDYWFVSDGVRIHKTVHHNLLRYVDGDLNDEDPEVTEVTWVPMSELIERLAYADERKLARIAVNRMPDLARKEHRNEHRNEHSAGRAAPQ